MTTHVPHENAVPCRSGLCNTFSALFDSIGCTYEMIKLKNVFYRPRDEIIERLQQMVQDMIIIDKSL